MENPSFENMPSSEGVNLSPELQKIVDEQEYIKNGLEKIRDFDKVTYEHSIKTANLVSLVAKELGLDEEDINDLNEAALLHDVGKAEVDPKVLFKGGDLSEHDWDKIRNHVHATFNYIEQNGRSEVAKIAVAHHDHGNSKSASRNGERRNHDKKIQEEKRHGNERRIYDERQIRLSKILSIVDSFEAQRSKRQYKENFSLQECEENLRENFPEEDDQKIINILLKLVA